MKVLYLVEKRKTYLLPFYIPFDFFMIWCSDHLQKPSNIYYNATTDSDWKNISKPAVADEINHFSLYSLAALAVNNLLKQDSNRSLDAACKFMFLKPYQLYTQFPTTNHPHLCSSWYERYK
jgi:hypothetical protein